MRSDVCLFWLTKINGTLREDPDSGWRDGGTARVSEEGQDTADHTASWVLR